MYTWSGYKVWIASLRLYSVKGHVISRSNSKNLSIKVLYHDQITNIFSLSNLNANTICVLRYVWSVSSRNLPLYGSRSQRVSFFTNVSISSGGLNLKPKWAPLLVDGFISVIHKVIGSFQLQIWRNIYWWSFPPKIILNIRVSVRNVRVFLVSLWVRFINEIR